MGSYYTLHVGSTEVLSGKNYLSPDLLVPFQSTDVRKVRGDCETDGHDGLEVYALEASAAVVGRRLDILGFTMVAASDAYSLGLQQQVDSGADYEWPRDLRAWQLDVVAKAATYQAMPLEDRLRSGDLIWEEHLLGFPEGDVLTVLRALVEASGPGAAVRLDLTDMVGGGWVDPDDENLCDVDERVPVVVLTEGKSDARLLRLALDTLFPDYADFVRFLDYDFAKAAGGVSEVVRFVKMFAGSGIQNRIVALFDNDTAGHQALGELGSLPPNVFPMCLPSMSQFESYPTVGPDGPGMSEVDRRACSLELYLGREALTDASGNFRPVRWTGFNEKLGRYHGEIAGKGDVQAKFEGILREVGASPEQRSKYDFAGIEMVFDAMFAALASR